MFFFSVSVTDTAKEYIMLTNYFSNPGTLHLIQCTHAAPYLDGFAAALVGAGYSPATIQRYIRSAAHLTHWQKGRARSLGELDTASVGQFKQHLRVCECTGFKRVNEYDLRGARVFLRHLQETAIIPTTDRALTTTSTPPLFEGFCDWMRQHHGLHDTTLNTYRRTILDAVQTLGSDPERFEATVQVIGKSRRTVQLPLPQDVGDALWHYLATARPVVKSDHLFLKVAAPVGPFVKSSSAVSAIVERAIHRAGVCAPAHGAQLLRHSAATALLADGASLESIAVLLRHRSLDTTAHYAKVDVKLLRKLAQPWPEVSPC